MVVVLASGVGLAALRSSTQLWCSGVFSATLLGFALAAAYATQRRGPRRAFWSAFVAFGVGYLVLAFGPWFEDAIRPRLLTTKLLDLTGPLLDPASRGGKPLQFSPDGSQILLLSRPPSVARIWGPDASRQVRFETIGHCLASGLLALLGGFTTRGFYERRDERRREAVEKAAGVLLRVIKAGL